MWNKNLRSYIITFFADLALTVFKTDLENLTLHIEVPISLAYSRG